MLSPFTPPGTLIACIDASPSRVRGGAPIPCTLVKGRVYRLAEIVEIDFLLALESHVALLADHARAPLPDGVTGWSLTRFKPAVLPSSLTSLQTTTPLRRWAPA